MLGAAADPMTGRANTEAWANYHLVAAFAGIAFIAWTYYLAGTLIAANQGVIQRMVERVAQIRRDRGLESE